MRITYVGAEVQKNDKKKFSWKTWINSTSTVFSLVAFFLWVFLLILNIKHWKGYLHNEPEFLKPLEEEMPFSAGTPFDRKHVPLYMFGHATGTLYAAFAFNIAVVERSSSKITEFIMLGHILMHMIVLGIRIYIETYFKDFRFRSLRF